MPRGSRMRSVFLACAMDAVWAAWGWVRVPPITGTRALTAVTEPISRSPRGELRAPFTTCQTPPPMAPMLKAPPMSSRMRCGQGSRSCTDIYGPQRGSCARAHISCQRWSEVAGRLKQLAKLGRRWTMGRSSSLAWSSLLATSMTSRECGRFVEQCSEKKAFRL